MKETEFRVGDLISAYHSGYHIVTEIEFRELYDPIIRYIRVVNKNGKAVKTKNVLGCDSSYCHIITKKFIDQLLNDELEIANSKHKLLSQFLYE